MFKKAKIKEELTPASIDLYVNPMSALCEKYRLETEKFQKEIEIFDNPDYVRANIQTFGREDFLYFRENPERERKGSIRERKTEKTPKTRKGLQIKEFSVQQLKNLILEL